MDRTLTIKSFEKFGNGEVSELNWELNESSHSDQAFANVLMHILCARQRSGVYEQLQRLIDLYNNDIHSEKGYSQQIGREAKALSQEAIKLAELKQKKTKLTREAELIQADIEALTRGLQ